MVYLCRLNFQFKEQLNFMYAKIFKSPRASWHISSVANEFLNFVMKISFDFKFLRKNLIVFLYRVDMKKVLTCNILFLIFLSKFFKESSAKQIKYCSGVVMQLFIQD